MEVGTGIGDILAEIPEAAPQVEDAGYDFASTASTAGAISASSCKGSRSRRSRRR